MPSAESGSLRATAKRHNSNKLAYQLRRLRSSSKTEVIRQAAIEMKERLEAKQNSDRKRRLLLYLENQVWSNLPKGASRRWTKAHEECALGYGKHLVA